jgi:nucleoside-diphosphate-sugar epimerase
MRVFVTGATGFIGSAVVHELLGAGHQVVGLARSDAAAKSLADAGTEVHRGDLEDLDSLRRGAADSEGVVHLGFIHDFARFQEVCEADRRAIEAMSEALAGSDRPLVVTSGTALVTPGRTATEDDRPIPRTHPRIASEEAAAAAAARGVRASIVRLSPSVHGDGDLHGFVPILIELARQKGFAAYVGDGANRWPAVQRLDAARLFRLAFEKAGPGATYHGVGDEGVPFRQIAEAIAKHLGVPAVSKSPEEATEHFGWFAHFASIDNPTSSAKTQELLGWKPTHATLLEDLERGSYFVPATPHPPAS